MTMVNGIHQWIKRAILDLQELYLLQETGRTLDPGRTKIGVYYNGTWYLDLNGNGEWDGTGPGNDATYNLR